MKRSKAIKSGLVVAIIVAGLSLGHSKPSAPKAVTGPAGPTYFAEIDGAGNVLRVIVVSQAFIDSGKLGNPSRWVQTDLDGSLRKNYASPGYKYDSNLNAFVAPEPADPKYILDQSTAEWVLPSLAPKAITASK